MKKANQQAVINNVLPSMKAFKTSKTVVTCHGNYSKKSVVLPGV